MKKLKIIFLSLIFSISNIYSQTYENKIYDSEISTVLIYKFGSELSLPIINLNADEKIILSFDNLNPKQQTRKYQYTIIHCNSQWQASDLMFSEYIEGFEENDIEQYKSSFSTFCKYVNYQLTLPNQYIKFLISGNYIIKIYQDYDTENVVLTKRFFVTENLVSLTAKVKKTSDPLYIATSHEVDFSIDITNYKIKSPAEDIQVIVSQNNRTDNCKYLKPRFISSNTLDYNYDKENVFEAGNEFHFFDGKELKFISEKVYNVQYEEPFYHLYLVQNIIRRHNAFISTEDINGKRLIKNNNAINSAIESDYCVVHFTLKRDFPLDNEVYIIGEFCDWNCNETNKMTYNYDTQQYEANIFLKQGYYNYIYVTKNKDKISTEEIEGNFYQTENEYIIYVYHHDINANYQRLIATKIVSN